LTAGIVVYYVISCICGIAIIVDALRRPSTQWVSADRDRSYWVMLVAAFSFLIPVGPLMGLIYLIGVLPRFSREADYDVQRFRKNR
jgi:hypothetical protein